MIKKLLMFSVAAMASMGGWAEVFFNYHSNDDGYGTITVTGVFVEGVMPNPLVIPSEYQGYTITRIACLEDTDFTEAKSIVLPNSLIAFDDNIFVDCTQLESVKVEPGGKYKTRDNMLLSVDEKELVAVYGKASFSRTALTIPDTVEVMGCLALFGSQKLKSIEIPKNVKIINGNPFVCCYSLEKITVHPENKYFKVENDCILSKDGKRIIALAGSYMKKRRDIIVPEGVEEIGQLSLTSDMVDIRNVWMPKTLKVLHDALEWGGNGGKNGEYGAMENVIFQSQEKFEIVAGACLFCDCDINNVWFAGPVPENFYSEGWWYCGNVRKIHYTTEYKDEWEEALRNIGYANRGQTNSLDEFPMQPKCVSVIVNGTNGSATGSGAYYVGDKVSLKATANKGFVFAGWRDVNSGDWLYSDEDYRSPSLSYIMTDSDMEIEAVFIPVEEDWVYVEFWPNSEYVTNEEISDIYISVNSGSLAALKVSGLPTGLKYTAKPVYDRNGDLLHEMNTIYGAPTKSGVYTVTVTATTAGKKTDEHSVVIVVRKDGERMIKLTVPSRYDDETDTDVIPGKVTGAGIYAEGKKVTLKATANKGFVFAGWRDVNSGDWLYSDEDYRSPSLSYIMTDSDMEIEAVFIPLEEDWVYAWIDCNDEYVTNEEILDIYIGADSGSFATIKVTGLPTGLKYTTKPVYDRNGDLLHEANTIYGTPTKSGVYTVTVTATTAGKKTDICSAVIVVRKEGEKVVIAECDGNGGKVTGGGVYATGKNVALKATANKGYVFAGWYEEEGFTQPCDSTLVDYRNPSYAYMMGADDKTFYARFEPVEEDTNLSLTVDGVAITLEDTPLMSFTVGSATNLPLVIDSLSLPKTSVKGLPAGMKFTDKSVYKKGSKTEIDVPANTIYGTPTTPGVYKVSVSLTNTSIKKAVVNEFEIVVPNLTDDMIPVEDEYGPYVPGVAYTNTIVAAAGCTVTGLPAGMKWTAKDILDSKTKEVVVPANSAYGAPTKPGKYTVYFTKTVDKVKHTATATFIIGDFPVVNVVTVGSGTGKVTGVGAFAANKKVTLKATADTKDDAKKGTKKSVFAGWYLDEICLSPVESTVDFRTASLPYVMTAEPETTLYAMFVTAEEDSDIMLYIKDKEITVNANDNNFVAEGTTILQLEMDSISIPKASVSGLPTGMKYTDKALTVKATKTEEAYDVLANAIYGTPTKPGLYTITVKLMNTTIKKAIEKKFTIEVPNLTAANEYFVDGLYNDVGEKYTLSVGISNIDEFLQSFKLNSATAKLAVTGLPSGLKYDANTGKITGIATKAGAYTVTLTVTDGKAKYVSTITIEVEALPNWVVGTFEGYAYVQVEGRSDYHDRIIYTISTTGKVSSKGQVEDSTWYTIKDNILTKIDDETYLVSSFEQELDFEESRSIKIEPYNIDGVIVGCLSGTIVGAEYEEWFDSWENSSGVIKAIQNSWSIAQGTGLAPVFAKDSISIFDMSEMCDDTWDPYYGGYLTLKYKANGALTTAYSETEGGKATATGSAQLVPYEVDGNITKAWLYTALKPRGRDPFGVLLFLSIDTSNGNVYGDDVMVEDYLLEVDD